MAGQRKVGCRSVGWCGGVEFALAIYNNQTMAGGSDTGWLGATVLGLGSYISVSTSSKRSPTGEHGQHRHGDPWVGGGRDDRRATRRHDDAPLRKRSKSVGVLETVLTMAAIYFAVHDRRRVGYVFLEAGNRSTADAARRPERKQT